MNSVMAYLLADKRRFFAAFGGAGGLLSAILTGFFGFGDTPFGSWVWATALDGAMISALLVFGQSRYLGKVFDTAAIRRALGIGALGGAAAGFVVVTVGQPLAYGLGFGENFTRFMGWVFAGGVVGFAAHKAVPNLATKPAVIAGAAGGFAGFMVMMFLGYSLAIATNGAIIGLAIALAEMRVRNMWLDVTIKPKGLTLEKERTVTVSLGAKPIVFGATAAADVQLAPSGTEKDFATVTLMGGDAHFHDLVSNVKRILGEGEIVTVSNAAISLKTKASP